jgi:hypothetical protein
LGKLVVGLRELAKWMRSIGYRLKHAMPKLLITVPPQL